MQGVELIPLIAMVRCHCLSDFEGVLIPGGRPGRRRPEGDVPASVDVDGDVSSLAEGV